MLSTWILIALSSVGSPGATAAGPGLGQDGLRPIGSEPDADDDFALPVPLDAVYWSAVLADSDLQAREEAYERLVECAKADPHAEEWLVEMSVSDEHLALAWTARLALRELTCQQAKPKRSRTPRILRSPSLMVGDQMSDELIELEERLKQLFGGIGVQVVTPPFADPLPPGVSRTPKAQHRIHVEQRPDGFKLRVHTLANGEESVEDYEGDSLEDLLRAHPELEDELGLEVFQSLGGRAPWQSVRISRGPRGQGPSGPGSIEHADVLGVRLAPLAPERTEELGLAPGEGLLVTGVGAGTIARAVGLEPGDVLLTVGERRVVALDDVTLGLSECDSGRVAVRWIDSRGRVLEKTWTPLEPVTIREE